MKKIISVGVFLLCMTGFTFAHQPRLVREQPNSESNPIIVTQPEVSQAFYGILSGQADYYQIKMNTGFLLYVNIVVPALSGQRTDFVVDISKAKSAISMRLDGRRFQRTGFYEEFAGDQYLAGPSWEKDVPAGTYDIIVSNKNNQGRYSLAIGKIESFPLGESLTTIARLPVLKTHFFEKSFFAIREGKIIQYLTYSLIILLLIIIVIIRTIRKGTHHKKASPQKKKKQ